ncbi:hypothetical protein PAJ34TS1_30890 [Paenibacillus azoreducens]|uniref:Uncharacterized protein n=1 Tax=Paenibacillus azoreducens TaxID=116718 RepID=A0A919Y8M7_9BACL|nr:hypothetical protein J34TS1_17810 [Paenibacillus azoreducens]
MMFVFTSPEFCIDLKGAIYMAEVLPPKTCSIDRLITRKEDVAKVEFREIEGN